MKKFILLFAVFICLFVAGCGEDMQPKQDTKQEVQTVQQSEPKEQPQEQPKQEEVFKVVQIAQRTYIASTNSDKFHNPGCRAAKKINGENAIYFSSREEAVNNGYSPCGICKP